MKIISVYESDDGQLFRTREEALVADVEFWKSKAKAAQVYIDAADRLERFDSSYDGGHQ